MNLNGVFPPITTPFRSDGEVDADAIRSNVARYMGTGIRGVVVLGTNGEAALLDEAESGVVIAAAREVTPKDRLLIAGAGRESTRATIAASRRAAELGADAVLVRTPSAYKARMAPEALRAHYAAVADASPIPLIPYNFTSATGVNLTPAIVAGLSEHANILGVKDSNGDMAQVLELVSRTRPGFSVLVGSAPTFYASLCLGAEGGILAIACVLPEACVRLLRFVREGHHAEALELQQRLLPLTSSVTTLHGIPGLKAALDAAGYVGGPPRQPLIPLSPECAKEIRVQLEDFLDDEP